MQCSTCSIASLMGPADLTIRTTGCVRVRVFVCVCVRVGVLGVVGVLSAKGVIAPSPTYVLAHALANIYRTIVGPLRQVWLVFAPAPGTMQVSLSPMANHRPGGAPRAPVNIRKTRRKRIALRGWLTPTKPKGQGSLTREWLRSDSIGPDQSFFCSIGSASAAGNPESAPSWETEQVASLFPDQISPALYLAHFLHATSG